MSVTIIRQGMLDTIQDDGRFGYQHLGINPNGSMDIIAASVANMLVGNARNEAVIELHFPASSFLFQEACLIAIAGADFNTTINNETVPVNAAVYISKGSVLTFTKYNKGCRCYLAVDGGWNVEQWLESSSTNLKASIGGYKGRALKKGDIIQFKKAPINNNNSKSPAVFALPRTSMFDKLYRVLNKVRCLQGGEYDWLSERSKKHLQELSFEISIQSDRMGYRLSGEDLEAAKSAQLLSSAATRGTIQLLPSGQLIVLMADHQTTGGYPKIAHVISADFPTLAQIRPLEKIQFAFIDHQAAEDAYLQQQEYLNQLEDEINLQLKHTT